MNKENIKFPWMTFTLEGKSYAVNSEKVTTIVIKPEETTYVPNVADYIVGLIHIRGNVVPLIDLKALFKMGKKEEDLKRKMVIVIENDSSFVGLVVEAVSSVENLNILEESEEVKKMIETGFVRGMAKSNKNNNTILIIDENKIIDTV